MEVGTLVGERLGEVVLLLDGLVVGDDVGSNEGSLEGTRVGLLVFKALGR